jgi:multidrug efflux pump subunit AcrB
MIALVIVLGLLVDNSAVVAEGYAKNRSEGLNPEEAAIKSAKLFFIPILATVLCNVAGFAPMLVTTGVLGQFVYSIPVIVSLAVVFSLIETFWLLPARLKFTLKNPPKPVDENTGFENNLFGKIQFKFFKIAKKLNSYKCLTLFLVVLFFISSLVVAVKFNKFELFPREQSEVYTARFETKIGNNLKSTDEQAKDFSLKIEETLKNNQIKYNAIVTRIGTSKMRSEDVAGKNASHVGMIYLSIPLDEALRLNTKEVLNILKSIPNNLNQVVWQEAGAGPPVGKPLTLIIRHNDFDKLKAYQKKIEEELGKVSGLINIENDLYRSPDEYGFEIDLDLIKEVGLSVEELGRSLQTSLVGDVVAKYNYQSKELDVRIKNQDEDKTNIENILNITVKNPESNYIPLKSFVKVNSQEGPYVRKRYEYQSAITITGDINDSTSSLEVNNQSRKILKSLQEKDSELSFFLGGEEENTRESFQSLLSALIISVLAILLILVLVYKSFLQSFLVLSTIPLGLAGVSYVFALADRPLSFMAFIGVIGLGGVVVNASIVLVSFINEAKKQNPEKDLVLLVSEVTALRFKAVFITNATTIMGLLPTAYGLGGNDVLLIPLTLAMGWGLIIGSLLALVWIPAGYLVIEQIKGKFYGKRRSS